MKLTEKESGEIGEALSLLRYVVRKLRFRASIRFVLVLIFMSIGWWNSAMAFSFGGAIAGATVNHALAFAWWLGFRKYYRALLKARRARTLMETCVWWERLGDGEEAMRQWDEVSQITNDLDNNISI